MASRTRITWLEQWVTPGVCLLARTQVPSPVSLGTLQQPTSQENGIWACVHEDEMALIDAPFPGEDADAVLELIDGFIARHRVRLKYIAATHLEAERAGGLISTLQRYQASTFVFPHAWQVQWQNRSLDRQQYGFQQGLSKQWDDPQHQPYEDCLETQLAGERMFFVDAPFRSLTDQLIVFRGVALVPNWHLPSAVDQSLPTTGVPDQAVRDTFTRLAEFDQRHRYGIHSSVAVSGNDPLRSDFQRQSLMGYLQMVRGIDT